MRERAQERARELENERVCVLLQPRSCSMLNATEGLRECGHARTRARASKREKERERKKERESERERESVRACSCGSCSMLYASERE